MVTISGIPLFYPGIKSLYFPANPEMRIRSETYVKKESYYLCFLTFFMQNLFANGFWSHHHNNFNDVKHQIREYKKKSFSIE
jgi:inner membrane protein